ncbi:MAG TPA: hypothetical protein VMC82_02120 [Thermoplasmata archaeon]|nr:hypothetical protein [Thermoplasmata archaeon]
MGGRADPTGTSASGPVEFDLVAYLAGFLGTSEPAFVLISGAVGTGKSTLLRSLVPRVPGPKLFLAFQAPVVSSSAPTGASDATPTVTLLLADPQRAEDEIAGAPHDAATLLAFGPEESGEGPSMPPLLAAALARMISGGLGTLFSDSWDRGSEAFFRSQANGAANLTTFTVPLRNLVALQPTILSTRARLAVCVAPADAAGLLSIADAAVELSREEVLGKSVRVVRLEKVRGFPPPTRQYLYSLAGGKFVVYPPLPAGFRPPHSDAERDPEPAARSTWPGSTDFARAFGRLRHGGLTLLTSSADCPDTVPHALVAPGVISALRTGGRVVWIPAPSVRPGRIVRLLGQFLPAEVLRERLRVLSSSGDDPSLGELRPVVLPLIREISAGNDLRAASSPGVGPYFREVYHFLRDGPESGPVVHVVSVEGLRSATATAGFVPDPTTVPSVVALYTRLPRYHLWAYGAASDATIPHLRPAADSVVHLEMVHGRPVLIGVRPETQPFLLAWNAGTGPYSLVPVE